MNWDRFALTLRQAEVSIALPVLFIMFLLLIASAGIFNQSYVPNVVTGLATVAGILTAFVGFWIVHLYSQEDDFGNKLFLFRRMISMITVLLGGLFLVIFGLVSLAVTTTLLVSFVFSVIGITVIFLVAVDVLLMLDYTDLSPKKPTQNCLT